MALHSLAWACGAAFHFPRLASAVRVRDWDACSVHIQMRETTPEGVINAGLRPRNDRNRTLMLNAQRVDAYRLDPDTLDWTGLLAVHDVPTVPALPTELETGSGPVLRVDPGTYLRPEDEPPDAA